MKRTLVMYLIGIVILTGCQKNIPTATDLLAKLLSLPETPSMTVYFEGAMPENTGYLTLEEEQRLYDGSSPCALSEEYAIALCRDDRVYELHVFHSLDYDKAELIENALRKRQTLLQKQENYLYDPQNPGAGAVIWRKGKWVCLLVTDDNDSAKAILKSAL